MTSSARDTQVKREGWLSDKTKEIKEVTIRGLEPEIQQLVQRHRKEMAQLQTRCEEDAKRQLDALCAQHDAFDRCAAWKQSWLALLCRLDL